MEITKRSLERSSAETCLCEALVTTVLGLLVAVPAVCFHNYLSSTVELFDIEMRNASAELLNYLAIHSGHQSEPHLRQAKPADPFSTNLG